MKIYGNEYPITVYKKIKAGYKSQTYMIVLEDKQVGNDRLEAFEFTNIDIDNWKRQEPHKTALKKYYKPVVYTNLPKDIKRKCCFVLVQSGINKPLNIFNERNYK